MLTSEHAFNILLVEADASLTSLMTTVLEEQGYSVIACRDDRQAVAALDRTRPDLVVLDPGPVGSPGQDVVSKLEHDEAMDDVPVLICATDPHWLPDVPVQPASRHWRAIQRPFDVDTLLGTVELLVDREGPIQELKADDRPSGSEADDSPFQTISWSQ